MKLLGNNEIDVGNRKWVLTLYLIRIILIVAGLELLLYLYLSARLNMAHTHIMDLFDMVNYFLLAGLGGASGIFVGGNVFEWKYRRNQSPSNGGEGNRIGATEDNSQEGQP